MTQCAIFCNVIDNFGDIGVCWRLARQLAHEYEWQVSLFVDDLQSFAVLAPALNTQKERQPLEQITVYYWHTHSRFEQPFDLVIEGFGCRLSDTLIAQMQAQTRAGQPVLWLNLEYLSAEDWVMDYHGMTSIHAATGLQQTFWFPSVSARSGGLLREKNLISQRDQFQQDLQQQVAFWTTLNLPDALQFSRKISLFSYRNTPIADLLTALEQDQQTTLLLVPYSQSIPAIEAWLGQTLQIGDRVQRQKLSIAVLPFLPHSQYDQLLWACDLNFVRGEDSCVRAHWAAKPFIWHIYPQDEQAHLVKLQAWMDQMTNQLLGQKSGQVPDEILGKISNQIRIETRNLEGWQTVMLAWNAAMPSTVALWQQFIMQLPDYQQPMAQWTDFLVQQPSLAQRLTDYFLSQQIK